MRSFFNNYIRNRFFNKLLLLYSVIIVLTVSILIFIIVTNITGLLKEQAITYNNQVLQLVGDHFHKQNRNLKNRMTNLYVLNGSDKKDSVYDAFADESPQAHPDQMTADMREKAAYVNRYMMDTVLSSDANILDMVMMNRSFDYEMSATRYSAGMKLSDYVDHVRQALTERTTADINARKTYVLPAFNGSRGSDPLTVYAVYDYIRFPDDPSDYSGYMLLIYDTESFRRAYEPYRKYLIGTQLVLTTEGEVVYDSSGKYYNQSFPYWDLVQESSDRRIIEGREAIVNVAKDDEFRFVTVGIIPLGELNQGIRNITRMMLIAASICLLVTIVLAVLSTRHFSKRLKDVLSRIKEIRKGNLTAIPVNEHYDEVGIISRNLNQMSEQLDEYIKREFVLELRRKDSELKQKTAELYALQSQINPHFLYNTLEAIRMKALKSGDAEVGQMIKILAKLFRSSIKEEMIVTVREEMNYCQSLLELYYIRFQGRLEIEFDVEEEILDFGVFRHMLQPIIENSIAHGIDLGKSRNLITVRGRQIGDSIVISVTDNGEGIDEDKLASIAEQLRQPRVYGTGSIGLLNVEARIKLIFGDECGIHIMSEKGRGTEVPVTVAARSKEALRDYVQGFNRG
ncbi:two-component sensor histidine kinase [Paenibacillus sp. 598K]|uniref:sensor histidine kinase n=1 Tax=Paenibacillus sp. 598K TaxID=1117987 RepID=UPI000FFA74F4|nr:sensor histidine kinase [Paenibacillus sp. 598K]GBF74392.1 two-component sensor histidine kinase [Paenibacillus sp. 598K]